MTVTFASDSHLIKLVRSPTVTVSTAAFAIPVTTRPKRLTRFTAEGIDLSRRVQCNGDRAVCALVTREAVDRDTFTNGGRKPDGLAVARVTKLDVERGSVIEGEAESKLIVS